MQGQERNFYNDDGAYDRLITTMSIGADTHEARGLREEYVGFQEDLSTEGAIAIDVDAFPEEVLTHVAEIVEETLSA